MRSLPAILVGVLLAVGASAPAAAQTGTTDTTAGAAPGRTISMARALEAVRTRWRGRIIAADLVPGRSGEATDLVYSVRLLSPAGALVRVRVDARDGAYLGAAGEGLIDARILPGEDG